MESMPESDNSITLPSASELSLKKSVGQINALGYSGLLHGADENQWEVMLREAVQNSWDARVAESIDFTVSGWRADLDWTKTISTVLSGEAGQRLVEQIGPRPYLLEVSDYKTSGLDGHTGYAEGQTGSNFRRFVFETGRSADQVKGGGSFGYGKASFFSLSSCGTVIVYTRVRQGERLESRLVIVRIDPNQDPGRIWWGRETVRNGDSVWVEPFVGSNADDLASAFGLGVRRGETGTSLLIIAPRRIPSPTDFEQLEPEETSVRNLADSIVKWFWPKFYYYNQDIRFSLNQGHAPVPIPDPNKQAPWCYYVAAYKLALAEGKDGTERTVIRSQRPKAVLGTAARLVMDFGGKYSMAYMRDVGFVVFYRDSDPMAEQASARFGVFTTNSGESDLGTISRERVNAAFRESENQSHDQWNPLNCRDATDQSLVRVALRQSWKFLTGDARSDRDEPDGQLVAVRDRLGSLLFRPSFRGPAFTSNRAASAVAPSTTLASLRKSPTRLPVFRRDAEGVRIGIYYDFMPGNSNSPSRYWLLPALRREDGSVGADLNLGIVRIVGVSHLENGLEVPLQVAEPMADGSLGVTLTTEGTYVVYCRASSAVILDIIVREQNEGARP